MSPLRSSRSASEPGGMHWLRNSIYRLQDRSTESPRREELCCLAQIRQGTGGHHSRLYTRLEANGTQSQKCIALAR